MTKKRSLIYVVDDDASVRKAFGRLLRSASLDAETFSSVEEFLSNPRQTENACIIIDIRIPGLSGFSPPGETGIGRNTDTGDCDLGA